MGIFDSKDQTTSTQTQYPAYITNALQNSFNTAASAASQPYQPYTGQQVAPFSDLQNMAFAGLPGAASSANPYINASTGLINNATQPVNQIPWSPEEIAKYSNPYTQSVINATQNQFNLQNAQQQAGLKGNAASQHALGGDREAVAAAQLAGQQQTAQAPVIAGLNNQNFQQATQEFNTQQQTDLAAKQANRYIDLYGAGSLGNLGQLAQGTGLAGAGALLQAGGLQQQQAQNYLNVPYQNYQAAQQWPFYTSGFLSSATTGAANPYQGNRTTTTPGPSPAGQVAGLASTFAGLGGFSSNTDLPLGGVFWKRGGEVPSRAEGGGLRAFADGGEPRQITVDEIPELKNFSPSDIQSQTFDFGLPKSHDPTTGDYLRAGVNIGGMFIPPLGAASSLYNLGSGFLEGFNRKTDPSGYEKNDDGTPAFTENNFINNALSGKNSITGRLGGLLGSGAGWIANQFDNPSSGYSGQQFQIPMSNVPAPQFDPASIQAPQFDFSGYDLTPAPESVPNSQPQPQAQSQTQIPMGPVDAPVGLSDADKQAIINSTQNIDLSNTSSGWSGGWAGADPFFLNGGQALDLGGAGAYNSIGLTPNWAGFSGFSGFGGGGGGGGGGSMMGWGGSTLNNGGWGEKRGGAIKAFADGGANDDFDSPDDSWLMQDDDESALDSNTAMLSQMGGLHRPSGQGGGEGASLDPEGNPVGSYGLAAAPKASARRSTNNGLDAAHQGLIAAGLGMMSAPGDFLSGVGKGGTAGLAAYQKALTEERQMKALEETQAYRSAMSQAALQRSEAMAHHYDNVDSKPIFDRTGKTLRVYYPSDKTWVDTHLPNNVVMNAERANELRAQQIAQGNRPTYQWQSGTQGGQSGVFRLPTHGGDGQPTFIPGSELTGKSGAGARGAGATQALVAQLIADKAAKNTQEALAIIRDPSGKSKSTVNAGLERIAASSAQKDPDFADDPAAVMTKWREYYGLDQVGAPPTGGVQPPAPAAAPAKPAGVPPTAQYSPSQGKWWWKNGNAWTHN